MRKPRVATRCGKFPGSFSSGSLGGGLAPEPIRANLEVRILEGRAALLLLGQRPPNKACLGGCSTSPRYGWPLLGVVSEPLGGNLPNWPRSGRAGPRCAPQTQPSHRQREGRCRPRHIITRVLSDPQDVEQTRPQSCIVSSRKPRKPRSTIWKDHSQHEVCTCVRAVDQQEPSRLNIGQAWDV